MRAASSRCQGFTSDEDLVVRLLASEGVLSELCSCFSEHAPSQIQGHFKVVCKLASQSRVIADSVDPDDMSSDEIVVSSIAMHIRLVFELNMVVEESDVLTVGPEGSRCRIWPVCACLYLSSIGKS